MAASAGSLGANAGRDGGSGMGAAPSALGGAAPLVVDRDAAPAPCGPYQRLFSFACSRSALLRNVALRIGLTFWLLFNACLAVAGWGFYTTMQQRVLDRTDDALLERYALVGAVYEASGIDGVIEIARGRELLPMHSSMGFHLSGSDGERIAGNVPAPPPEDVDGDGWSIVRGGEVGMPSDSERYRFLTVPLGEDTLSLGRGLGPLDELRSVAAHCLAYMFGFSTLLALLGAALISRRLKRRSDGWADALDRLAGGALAARVPVSCARDSIDDMALTVNAALGRLETNVETMRQVSTNIAHDLKTPMNRLWIHLEDAAGEIGAPDTDRLEHALGDALDEAKHVNDTFEALLRVAQIEGGARRTKFHHFDLAEVLRTAAEVYEPVVEDSCDSLVLSLSSDASLPMHGDRELVLQLVVNLIENSIRHCLDPETGRGGPIEIGGRETGDGAVELHVADRGPGIPEAEREKVFQRLYRLERSRTTGGTGLGLALVKAVADLHCGRIALSDEAPGLRVTVSFARDCPVGGKGARWGGTKEGRPLAEAAFEVRTSG